MTSPLETIRQALADHPKRFGNYQAFPDGALAAAPELAALGYRQTQVRLDHARLGWLLQCYDETGFQAVEIGANLGFFTLSLGLERAARVLCFEPLTDYARVTEALAELCGIGERVTVRAEGLCLADLDGLPKSDLIVTLNVLHHGGYVFDSEAMAVAGSWRAYARHYLSALARRSRHLFLQTGNKSHGPAMFPSEDAVPFVAELLEESGWQVVAAAAIDDFDAMTYRTFAADRLAEMPATACRRDPESNLVEYVRDGTVVARLSKGMAQRPLWFCRSRDFDGGPAS